MTTPLARPPAVDKENEVPPVATPAFAASAVKRVAATPAEATRRAALPEVRYAPPFACGHAEAGKRVHRPRPESVRIRAGAAC